MKNLLTAIAIIIFVSPGAMGQTKKAGIVAAGKKSYMMHCEVCHGENADGKTQIASSFSDPIPDYRSKTVQSLSNDEIAHVITDGKAQMPAVAGVEASEVPDLVAYVRSFGAKKKAASKASK